MIRFEYDAFDDDILVIGKGGRGKTHLMRNLIIPALRKEPFWLWDPQWQYSNVPAHVTHRLEDMPYARAIFQPIDKSDDVFDSFCKKAESWDNLVVAVEEAHLYSGKYKIRSRYFEKIVKSGRPHGVTWIAVGRRPQMIHNDILSDADHVFCFEMELSSDFEYMSKWIGEKVWLLAEPERRRALTDKPRAAEHSCVYYNAKTGQSEVFKL